MSRFRPAHEKDVDRHIMLALAGPSGSGKTYTALEIATGLAGESGRIAIIDTEAGRALHYRDFFRFDHADLSPPFTPEAYIALVEEAESQKFDVVVIDSASHEWDGEGGLHDMAESSAAGANRKKQQPGDWTEPKKRHRKMVNRFLQMRCDLIFCLRAEEKIKMEKVNGRTVVENAGWKPICERKFMYEMTASFMMSEDRPGCGSPIKSLQDQFRPAFKHGNMIDRSAGAFLRKWSKGEIKPDQVQKELLNEARAMVAQGRAVMRSWMEGLTPEERATVNQIKVELSQALEEQENTFERQIAETKGGENAAVQD